MRTRNGYVYLMTNKLDTVIYTGVTADLRKRVYEHKEGLVNGFT
ncbi:MAG: GIY-YIG nuclease family protein, partial [Candidatus Omnitrophota bacterium]|nr:GIY-YIG nuclease family protein [Candidatus Omnitrophota bacterium]